MENSQPQSSQYSYIQTMASSLTNVSPNVSPFICNLEQNSEGNLIRRRGTALYDTIEVESTFTYVKTLASSSTYVIFSNPDKSVSYNINVIVVLYSVKSSTGAITHRIHISSARPDLKIVQMHTDIPAILVNEAGIQTDSDANNNSLYIYLNGNNSNTNYFDIKTITFSNVTSTGFTVASIAESTFSSNASPRYTTSNRTFTIGINRTFISEINTVFYNSVPYLTGIPPKVLDGSFSLGPKDIILKIIEFDNSIFVVTHLATYKAVFTQSAFHITRISNNISAASTNSILVVGNFAYIPTIDGAIYKINLKSSNIQVDSYADKIGTQIAPLIKHSKPLDCFYDSYNDTINFLFRNNLGCVNQIMKNGVVSGTDSRMPTTDRTTISTIVLSKHFKVTNDGMESWTSKIFNYDVAGIEPVILLSNSNIPSSDQEDALSLTEKSNVLEYSDEVNEYLYVPIIISAFSNRIFKMSYLYRLDDNSPFNIVIGLPVTSYTEMLQKNKYVSLANLQVVVGTDFTNDYNIYNSEDYDDNNIMLCIPSVFSSDMSSPPTFMRDHSASSQYSKSAVSVINCTVNSMIVNGCVFCYFPSNNISSFISYRLDY